MSSNLIIMCGGCDSDVNEGKYNPVYYFKLDNNYAELLQSLNPETYLGKFTSNFTSTYFTSNALKQYI